MTQTRKGAFLAGPADGGGVRPRAVIAGLLAAGAVLIGAPVRAGRNQR